MCTANLTTVVFSATSDPAASLAGPDPVRSGPTSTGCPGKPYSGLYAVVGEQGRYFIWTEHFPLPNGKSASPLSGTEWGASVAPTVVVERSFTLTRDVGERRVEPPSPWIYIVATDIPEDVADEYVAWYDQEHLPRLVTVPGVRRARRFVATSGSPKFLTAYNLDERDAFNSPDGLSARKTPWTARMRELFTNTERVTCALISPLRPDVAGNIGSACHRRHSVGE